MKTTTCVRERAAALVKQMTTEEKLRLMVETAEAVERLGIPKYYHGNEALHGVVRPGRFTVFPQAIAFGAMFDDAFLETIARAISTEARAKYFFGEKEENGGKPYDGLYNGLLTFWSPDLNLARDPRWGRTAETYGEDPYLAGKNGAAFVRGLQGDDKTFLKAVATPKHFTANNEEHNRFSCNAVMSEKTFREYHLEPFRMAVQEGHAEAVMAAYNAVNGVPCHENRRLLTEILRGEWGFDGYVVSDCGGVISLWESHHTQPDEVSAAAAALNAGVDLECSDHLYKRHLKEALEKGMVTQERIDEAVTRVLTARIKAGQLDDPKTLPWYKTPFSVVGCEAHGRLAYEAAVKSAVLLKNNGILPLDKSKLKSVAVIGPNASSLDALRGNYYGTSAEPVTFLDGIRKELGDEVKIYYSEGCHLFKDRVEHLAEANDRIAEAMAMVQAADVTILCLGLDANIEGEEGDEGNAFAGGDKLSLELPVSQRILLEKVLAAGKPTVLVLAAGSSLNPHADRAGAILQVWYPGECGGTALANILFGKVSPSGKLPVTFYESTDALPEFTDYSMAGRTYRYLTGNVLYPFGFGLTYSTVSLSDMKFADGKVSVTVTNTGSVDTDEVVQVYVRDLESPFEVTNYRLCAFQRVSLKAGCSERVSLPLDKNAFTLVNEEGKRVPGSGKYRLWAGVSQPDVMSESLSGTPALSLQI